VHDQKSIAFKTRLLSGLEFIVACFPAPTPRHDGGKAFHLKLNSQQRRRWEFVTTGPQITYIPVFLWEFPDLLFHDRGGFLDIGPIYRENGRFGKSRIPVDGTDGMHLCEYVSR
jgi:hypothetical protein